MKTNDAESQRAGTRLRRLQALRDSGLLDGEVDHAFDLITRLAASMLKVPVALMTLLDEDRQFLKSQVGLAEPWASLRQTPLSHSFCRHVVDDDRPFAVSDARLHPRVRGNPAIADLGVVAYLGAPLRLPEGITVGALCVIQDEARDWTLEEVRQLEALSKLVVDQIVLRRHVAELSAVRAELDQDRSRFQLALDHALHGICFFDGEDRLVAANARYAALLRLPPAATAPGTSMADLQALRIVAGTQVVAESARSGGDHAISEKLLADGRTVLLHRTRIASGGWVGTLEDVTERQAAEEALRASEQRFRLLADNSNDVIILGHVDGRKSYYSPAVEKLTGYTPQEALAVPMTDWVHPDDLEDLFAATSGLSPSRRSVVVVHRLRRKDGQHLWVESSFSLVASVGSEANVVANIRDVTGRRTIENEYRNLFERTVVGVYRRTLDGMLIRANPALARMRGFASEARLLAADRSGRSLWRMDPERKAQRTALVMSEGVARDFVSTVTHAHTGERRTISETAWLVHDDAGEPLYIEGLVLDVTEQVRAQEAMEHFARHDPLTGLLNRKGLAEVFAAAAAPPDERLVALYADLDGFKGINDTLGHRAGDKLLQAVAGRLREVLGADCAIARLGGDEFVAVVRGPGAEALAERHAVRLIVAVQHPIEAADGRFVTVAVSIGIAAAAGGADLDDLLAMADAAMYRAKAEGRNAYCWHTPAMAEREAERRMLEIDVREALAKDQVEAWFQPIRNLGTGDCAGFEALMRWRHPVRGLLAPDAFLAHVEECGLIVPFGESVLRQALDLARTLPGRMRVAVNMSAQQISHPAVVRMVEDALAARKLPPSRLEIEVTENALIRQDDAHWRVLASLQEMGVSIALDDFGTGWSSLSYLSRFRFDRLKIDKSFIRKCAHPRERAILETIIDMGRRLGMTLVAEGLERPEHLALVRGLGCHEGQGYIFLKPVPAEQARDYVRAEALARAQHLPGAEDAVPAALPARSRM